MNNVKILFELFLEDYYYEADDIENEFFICLKRHKPVEISPNELGLTNTFDTNKVVEVINNKIEGICKNDKDFSEFNVLSEIVDVYRRGQGYLTEDDRPLEFVLNNMMKFRVTIIKDDKILEKKEYWMADLDTIDKYYIYDS